MFNKLRFEHILKSKTATGIEIILLPDGTYEINEVTLKRNKSEVVTETKLAEITNIAALASHLNFKNPLVLVINGKGIIHRKITISENDSQAAILNKVLPNANVNEFYIQQQKLQSTQTYISVIRASVINDLLEELKKNNITNIVGCFIGPFLINNVLSLVDKKNISNEFLTIGNYKLLIREDEIQEIQTVETPTYTSFKIGEELLKEQLLIAYAAALSYFIGIEEGAVNATIIESTKKEYQQKQKFQFFGWTLLIATFVVLIVNYLVFNHYWEKSNALNSTLILNQSALKKYESLKVEYAQKKGFLEQNGLLEIARTSYYADQLAASIPASIQLLEMNIHPLKKKEASDVTNAFYFENQLIKISGKCNRNTELNDWMKALKEKNWIENVSLLNYKQDNAKDDGVFFIELKLK
jgi:Tfp pilus assembly protein PilN